MSGMRSYLASTASRVHLDGCEALFYLVNHNVLLHKIYKAIDHELSPVDFYSESRTFGSKDPRKWGEGELFANYAKTTGSH
jgi:hypothetical protein